MWIVRKYVAYLVFNNNNEEKEQSAVFAFEPVTNKVAPAIFESQETSRTPYLSAKRKAKELNKKKRKK